MVDFDIAMHRPVDAPTVAIVTVTGDVDMWTASRVEEAVTGVGRHVVSDCIVDLTNVEFFDSAGIGALLRAKQQLDGRDIRLWTCPSERVRVVFEITGLVSHFRATLSPAEVLDACRSTPAD